MSKHKMLQIIPTKKSMTFDKKRWRIFADWLKPEREAANLSQDGLADLIGVDRQTVYRLENALSGTRRETVIRIANALNSKESIALNKAGFSVQDAETIVNERLASINTIYGSIKNPKVIERANYLFEMLENEIKRLAEDDSFFKDTNIDASRSASSDEVPVFRETDLKLAKK